MPDDTKSPPQLAQSKDSLYALFRFLVTLFVLALLAIADLVIDRAQIPTLVYVLIGGLNGVDAYKLFKEINK